MKKIVLGVFFAVLAYSAPGLVMAGNVPTPTDPPKGVTMISAEEAKELIGNKDVHFFDMRKALNYGKGHLPGAVSIPYKWTKKGHPSERTGEYDMSKLPDNKNAKIVFHSDGPNGWKSYYASKEAVEAGYENVMWLRDGFATWQERGYPLEH